MRESEDGTERERVFFQLMEISLVHVIYAHQGKIQLNTIQM